MRHPQDVFIASDGSASKAMVYVASIKCMDVAGVAIDLVSRAGKGEGGENDSIVLFDILGAENHFGDMEML